MMERAVQDWLTGKGGNREQTHVLIVQSILATIRHILPAVMQVAGEGPRRNPKDVE